ncbi:Sodium:solute symporter family-domain-containing protein [Dactylonectria estremocensis]|uniref:Sodium:solute symporter family-domain-containing protein n=1 Tax=Dactylonectria estremocensis TaxID=1079267 RepID=A0A9P9E8T3_9HYPO|nr:Sodium:solute symporter family-domain-containing protein [Dactylonectria estremocensis]
MAETSIFPIFHSGVGYGIIVGLGGLFAILMTLTTFALRRFFSEVQDSEMYLTAKRSIKAGLIASSVVSSWTLSATLLTSTTFGYSYGIAATFWFGAGCSVPILTFAVLAIELKRKAPNAHTFLELVKHRYGAPGHIVLAIYSLIYQIFIAVNLLVGGADVFNLVTGMNKVAVCFLFPLGVCIYTLFGGIKATFLTEWVHTVIIFVIMLSSMFVMYATSEHVGSPGRMWELLKAAAEIRPVEGNAGGELLTMRSISGGLIGLIFLGGGFSATVDSQLFQKAIAADPKSTVAGYLLGSLCWFTIPFCISTTFGLGGAALEHTPSWPTYPVPLSVAEINSALIMPYTAYAIMGKGGVVAVLLMIFQAITSAMSSETVAVTSLVTYDFYRSYINPNATGERLVFISHIAVVGFGLLTASIAVGLCYAGFSVTFIVTAIGILTDGAVIPSACTLLWKKQNKYAVVLVPLISSLASIGTWIGVAYKQHGAVTIATLSDFKPTVAGNMLALTAPIVLTPLITYLKPDNYDFEKFKELQQVDDSGFDAKLQNAGGAVKDAKQRTENELENLRRIEKPLLQARNFGLALALFIAISMTILWPIPMYATSYVFSKSFFTGWIVVTFIWGFFGAMVITIVPIVESRREIREFFVALVRAR